MSARARRSLGDILDQTAPDPAASRLLPTTGAREGVTTVRRERVAPNPLNARAVHARPAELGELARSLVEYGQMQSCTVVTRAAFVAAFPELAETVGAVEYVQVSGGRRLAAAEIAGMPNLAITVRDDLAQSRAKFVGATAAENIDRETLDPVEEAAQLDILVRECGSNKAAAEQLGRSQPWVSRRLNLLLLVDELQAAVRSGEMPVREVRDLHRATPVEQLAALTRWRALVASRKRRGEQVDQPDPAPRPVPATATVRFADDPARTAAAWRTRLPADYRRALAEALLRDLDE